MTPSDLPIRTPEASPVRAGTSRAARLLALCAAVALAVTLLPSSPAAARAKIGARFFGMTDSSPVGTAPDSFPQAPVGSLRLWDTKTTWRDIEKSPGVYDFAYLDQVVSAARSHGAKPLLVLGQTPEFYAVHPNQTGSYGKGAPSMPSIAAWKHYVAAVAIRYGSRIDYQIWNEPNVIQYWRGSPKQMATLTQVAKKVLDKRASRATVVAPSFPLRLGSQRKWVSRYYKAKVKHKPVARYVDVVALNLYPLKGDGPEASMSLLRSGRKILKQRGVSKPIWNTEINYGLIGGGKTAKHISARRGAAYVARTFALNAGNGIKRVYWYAWDTHRIANTEMTQSDSATLTKAGNAYLVVHSWLAKSRVTSCTLGAHKVYVCTAKYSGGVKRIYWKAHGHARITTVKSSTYVEDMMGNRKKLHGAKHLKVGYAPVLVRSRK